MTAARSPAKRNETAQVYVALLRGINVGGKNPLPMKDLTEMFSRAGCGQVRSYIQSGNVLFTAAPSLAERLPGEISAQVKTRFGYRAPVLLRTAGQLSQVLRNNPFLNAGAAEETLHVVFLEELPNAVDVARLDPNRSSPDEFAVREREIYLRLPNGMARSKLTNSYFDSRLKTTSSARNWRTVAKLYELMTDLAPLSKP